MLTAEISSLYAEHFQGAVGVARTVLRDLDRAVDAAQDALVGLWRAMRAGLEVGCGKAYLLRAARNKAIDARRRASARRERGELPCGAVGRAEAPDARADQQERVRAIRRAVNTLEGRERYAIELLIHGESSYDVIGEALGTSAGNARQIVCRARKKIARALELANVA